MNKKQYIGLLLLSVIMMFISGFFIGVTYEVLGKDSWIFVIAIMGWMFMKSFYSIIYSIQELMKDDAVEKEGEQ